MWHWWGSIFCLTLPCSHDPLIHTFNIAMFDFSKGKSVSIKHDYNEMTAESTVSYAVDFLHQWVIKSHHWNGASDWHGGYYSISQEICARFLLCCGYTLTDFPISIRLTSLALWQSNDCPFASKATLMNMDNYFMWIHYERLHNHNKAKHNKTVCIFLGIYCSMVSCVAFLTCKITWHQAYVA